MKTRFHLAAAALADNGDPHVAVRLLAMGVAAWAVAAGGATTAAAPALVGSKRRYAPRIHILSATKSPRPNVGWVTWGRLGFSSPPRERTP